MVERDVGGSGRGQEAKVEIQSQASAEEGDWPGVSGRHPSCSSIPSPRGGGQKWGWWSPAVLCFWREGTAITELLMWF